MCIDSHRHWPEVASVITLRLSLHQREKRKEADFEQKRCCDGVGFNRSLHGAAARVKPNEIPQVRKNQ